MADVQDHLRYTIDLNAGLSTQVLSPSLLAGDQEAHKLIITAVRGLQPVDLTGAAASGMMIRADGATVPLTGKIVNGVAEVVLDAACYEVIGRFSLVVRLSSGSVRNGVLRLEGNVDRSRSDVLIDPSHIVPSIDELLSKLAEVDAAAKAANAATTAANTAAGSANSAAANANTKASAADTAAKAANAATAAANTAADSANSAAANANTKASAADTAAKGAEAVSSRLDNMSVKVTTLAPGTQATGSLTQTETGSVLNLGIPRGESDVTRLSTEVEHNKVAMDWMYTISQAQLREIDTLKEQMAIMTS